MKVLVLVGLVGTVVVLAAPRPQNTGAQQASPQGPTLGAPVWPIRPYVYTYETNDPLTNNHHNKAERKTATGDVFGSYSVLMPDGYIYTTTYNVTGNSGFLSSLVKTLASLSTALPVPTAGPGYTPAVAAAAGAVV